MTTTAERFEAVRTSGDLTTVLAFYDSLPAVTVEEMLGSWDGTEVPTGHPLDGLLDRTGWRGKRFESAEDVHPLVMDDGRGGRWSLNPALVPMGLLTRTSLLHRAAHPRLLRALRPLAGTTRPGARLRLTEVRGVVTATMHYDALPVHDAFRRVDERTVLGLMDLRGAPPYAFALHRSA